MPDAIADESIGPGEWHLHALRPMRGGRSSLEEAPIGILVRSALPPLPPVRLREAGRLRRRVFGLVLISGLV